MMLDSDSSDAMGRVILLRHGRSIWNRDDRFAGWIDIPLDECGVQESLRAGRALASEGLVPDVVLTSLLVRASDTARHALVATGLPTCRIIQTWRLNERHYGALQGRLRSEVTEVFGEDQVGRWRRSFEERPPPRDPHTSVDWGPYPEVSVPGRATPVAESLSDVEERLRPFVTETLCEERKKSKVVLIVAHGNTIRVLVKMLLGLPSSASLAFDVPTGTPIPVDDDLAERLRITGQPGPGN